METSVHQGFVLTYLDRLSHVISILSASQLHFLAKKTPLNWLVAANKLHKHRETCCAAEGPYCPFAIL